MMARHTLLTALLHDEAGSMAIETAIVAPVLALMSLGGFEVSTMVARQAELQSAAAEAEAIALAVAPDDDAKRGVVEDIVEASIYKPSQPDAGVATSFVYRCGTATAMVTTAAACGPSNKVSTYLRIVLTDTYTPQWTEFGVGQPLDYNVTRTVMIS